MGPLSAERAALSAIARVLALGATDDSLSWLVDIPGLESIVESSEDERLAEHERVLGRGVFAYESVFTRMDALRSDEAVAAWYAKRGFAPEQADQLGVELAYVAQTDDPAFIEAHLARWAVPALIAIERQDSGLYGTLARLARELLKPMLAGVPVALPPVDDPLDNPKTGLRRLAEHLLVPVKSGWFLSRGDVLRLAAESECPCGFGSRVQMLETLLRTAVDQDRLGPATDALIGEVAVWQAILDVEAPAWGERVGQTKAVLERLAAGAADPED